MPLIASYPGHLPAGAVYHHPITQLDLYPTILAAMGIPAAQWPADLDGLNLLPYLEAKVAGAPHESLFWSLAKAHGKWAVRQGRWKLVNEDTIPTLRQGQTPTFQTQLYDLEADAFEQHDRSALEPQRVAALQQLIEEFQSRMKPTLYTPSERLKHEAELAERQKHPELNSHPRRDGAPGHWFAH